VPKDRVYLSFHPQQDDQRPKPVTLQPVLHSSTTAIFKHKTLLFTTKATYTSSAGVYVLSFSIAARYHQQAWFFFGLELPLRYRYSLLDVYLTDRIMQIPSD
jgi:hypothetical protein